MASFESAKAVNLIAGEDLRSDLHEILKFEDDSGVAKVIKATGVTDSVIGILAEDPSGAIDTDGETVPVVLLTGVVKVKAGGTVVAGALVVPDSTAGRVVTVANIGALAVDSMAIGIALTTAVDGEIFEMLAMPIAAPHSA